MSVDAFVISPELLREIIDHAREEAPFEACGMIGGRGMIAQKVYRAPNADSSNLTYSIDPADAFAIIKQMRRDGVDFIACYHSHPATEPYPSPTDKAKAFDAQLVYAIVSLKNKQDPVLKAYRMDAGRVIELPVDVR